MSEKAKKGILNAGERLPRGPDHLIVELRHDSGIIFENGRFTGTDEKSAAKLNELLGRWRIKRVEPLFDLSKKVIRKRITEAPESLDTPVSAEFAHAAFYKIIPPRKRDIPEIAAQFKRLKCVWNVEIVSRPVRGTAPAGASTAGPNFEPCQGYLASSPYGVGVVDAWTWYVGAKGAGITICDIEGAWNFDHRDLPEIKLLGGDPSNNQAERNHGTAVVGQLVAKGGRSGVIGICPQSRATVQADWFQGSTNVARAIVDAAGRLNAGDIIVIEAQEKHPNEELVAVQYRPSIFSAIRTAVAKNISVVETAGNGRQNFQAAQYSNSGLQKDAGAIVVGAGVPPTNFFDFSGDLNGERHGERRYEHIAPPRSREFDSNYGDIVSLQAWGRHVSTLGYGDAQGGPDENEWYTHRFAGTSSAAPIVGGVLACLQSRALIVNGAPLGPRDARRLLIETGVPQEDGSDDVPASQTIGPQPDLLAALDRLAQGFP